MVKIRLRRMGAKKKLRIYRIVVADSRYPARRPLSSKRSATYDPKQRSRQPSQSTPTRPQQWIKNGAQPTDTVRGLLKKANVL